MLRLTTLLTLLLCVIAASRAVAQPPAATQNVQAGGLIPNPATMRATWWSQAATTTYELTSGVNLHVKAMKRPGPPRVLIVAFVPGVELTEDATTRGRTVLACEALKPAAGPAHFRAHLRPEGLILSATIGADDVTAATAQLTGTLTAPAFDPAAFQAARERALLMHDAWTRSLDATAASVAIELLAPAGDPRLHRPTVENLKSADFQAATDDLLRAITTRAVDVAIVGHTASLDLPALRQALARIPTRTRDTMTSLRSATRPQLPPEKRDVKVNTARLGLTIAYPAPPISDLPQARLALLSARILERTVADDLKAGGFPLTSSSSTPLSGRAQPKLGSTVATFIFSPGPPGPDLAAARQTTLAAVERLRTHGPTPDQVQAAVKTVTSELDSMLESPDYWATSLSLAWFLAVPVDELGTAPAALRAASPEQLRDFAKRWYTPEGAVAILSIPPAAQ